MGAKGVAGLGVVTIRTPKHVRHDCPRSPTILDYGSIAQDVPIFERRFWVVQPNGGPPRREIHVSSRPQGRVFRGRLPE